jgi:beta-lactamase class A
MPTRREALLLLNRALLAGAVVSLLPPVSWAAHSYDVLYFDWVERLDDARDHLGALEEGILSVEEAARLQIVSREQGGYAVIYRFLGTEQQALALASEHATRLGESSGSDETLAHPIRSTSYRRLYNVSYGLGPNLEALKAHWEEVARMLGSGVAKALYIEQTDAGNYALVYKRYGDVESTADAARRHDRLLRGTGVRASFIEERNNEIVWTGSSAAEAALEPRAPREPEPEPNPSEPAVEASDPGPGAPGEPSPEPAPPTGQADPPAPDPLEPVPEQPGPELEPGEPGAEPEQPGPASSPPAAGPEALVEGSSPLRDQINDYIQDLRKRGRVAGDEQTSWLVYDLRRDETVAVINGDASRQAASMIKPLVMLAFFHRVQAGQLEYGPKSEQQLRLMIQKSSNSATNWVMDQAGGPERVHALLQEHYGALLPHTHVVERIAAGGRTYRNRASANDYGRFLRAAWFDRLPRAREMLRIMNLPGRDRLYYGAPSIPVGTLVFNKTGSTAMLCGDMGILVGQKRGGGRVPYIMVGIIEKAVRTSQYTSWIGSRSAVIREVSDLSYRYMRQRHGLL